MRPDFVKWNLSPGSQHFKFARLIVLNSKVSGATGFSMRIFNRSFLEKYFPLRRNGDLRTWRRFQKHVRSRQPRLFSHLHLFPNSILVAGCQRSGTTLVTRLINRCEGMVDFRFGRDDELDAAQILCGYKPHTPSSGRYCFQTTYLNERYREYLESTAKFQLIWVIRKPSSVVYSLLYNWSDFALEELFETVGRQAIPDSATTQGLTRLLKACYCYNGKQSQLFELHRVLQPERLMVIDYDRLMTESRLVVEALCEFISLPFSEGLVDMLDPSSLQKADRLSTAEQAIVARICLPTYERAVMLA